jgi:uncharacterized protein YjiS (DUF1127 family)
MRSTNQLIETQLTTRFVPGASGTTSRARSEMDASALRAAAANGFGDAGVTAPMPASKPTRAPASAWSRLRRFGTGLIGKWLTGWQARAEVAALDRLDAATLRDLGIHRSELGSYAMESRGVVPITRRRVVNRQFVDRAVPYIKRVDEFL